MARQPLALDFFLIAHDPFDDGRLRISTELLGCGLVGAELADLALAHRLGIDGDDLVVLDPGGQLDEVDDYVIEAVGSQESVHPVRTWVEPLQDGLYALIARKLVAAGTVRRQQAGRRIGRGRQADRSRPTTCSPLPPAAESRGAPADAERPHAGRGHARRAGRRPRHRWAAQPRHRPHDLRELLAEIEQTCRPTCGRSTTASGR